MIGQGASGPDADGRCPRTERHLTEGPEFDLGETAVGITQGVHDHAGRDTQPSLAEYTLELQSDQCFGTGKV